MPSYTFRSAGAVAEGTGTLSPGAPTGKASGDLLLLASASRTPADTPPAAPSGWTLLLDTTSTAVDSLVLYGRIADGGADDTPTLDWSGTSASVAQIAAFYGDVWSSVGSIVAHSSVAGVNSGTVDIPNPALTITTDNCLIIGVGKKGKTATSDGATVSSPSGLNNRIGFSWVNGSSRVGFVWDYTQQTTAANIGASVWDQSVDESVAYASMVVALKTEAATIAPKASFYRMLRAA